MPLFGSALASPLTLANCAAFDIIRWRELRSVLKVRVERLLPVNRVRRKPRPQFRRPVAAGLPIFPRCFAVRPSPAKQIARFELRPLLARRCYGGGPFSFLWRPLRFEGEHSISLLMSIAIRFFNVISTHSNVWPPVGHRRILARPDEGSEC
jgi:hypothetical protein